MLMPTQLWVAVEPMYLRFGMDRSLVAVRTTLDRGTFDGGAFVFGNRSGSRIKVPVVDTTGVWLCVRRLREGRFVWPRNNATSCELDAEPFAWLCAAANASGLVETASSRVHHGMACGREFRSRGSTRLRASIQSTQINAVLFTMS